MKTEEEGQARTSSNATAEQNFEKPTVDERGRCNFSQGKLNSRKERPRMP
jgi:hypothetical protein